MHRGDNASTEGLGMAAIADELGLLRRSISNDMVAKGLQTPLPIPIILLLKRCLKIHACLLVKTLCVLEPP